jgi:hypothetical protein
MLPTGKDESPIHGYWNRSYVDRNFLKPRQHRPEKCDNSFSNQFYESIQLCTILKCCVDHGSSAKKPRLRRIDQSRYPHADATSQVSVHEKLTTMSEAIICIRPEVLMAPGGDYASISKNVRLFNIGFRDA